MALGIYRIPGVRLPHPPIPVHLSLIVEQAITEAWKRLKRKPPTGFNIKTATEDVVTYYLHYVLVNDVYRKRRVPGFTSETFSTPQREPKVASYNLSSLDKMPDLRVDLVDHSNVSLLTDNGLFIECKPIDQAHAILTHYCRKGISRFINGEYGWAMPGCMMIAYVNWGSKSSRSAPLFPLNNTLLSSQNMPSDEFSTTQLPTACNLAISRKASVVPWITRHQRKFTYIQTGTIAPEIIIRHLWLTR